MAKVVENAPVIQCHDGVAFGTHGDVIAAVYMGAARLHRSRWLFDRADVAVRRRMPDGFLVVMVILPTADGPDAETRAENAARMRALAPHFRRFVTVALGDTFQRVLVRAVMRALSVLQGRSRIHRVFDEVDPGLSCLLEAHSEHTPTRADIEGMLRDLYAALGWADESRPGGPGDEARATRWRT